MDGHSLGNGQFRYATDLMAALAQIDFADKVTVFGTRPFPPERISCLFQPATNWVWVHKPFAHGRMADWSNQWRSFWFHRQYKITILHIIDSTIPVLPPCPVVLTAYDLMPEIFAADYPKMLASRGYRRFRWLSRHRVTKFLAISHATAADYHRLWKIPENKIATVHLAVSGFPADGHHSDWPATLALRFPKIDGRRFLLAPYNLEPRKNLDAALVAFSLIHKYFPDLVFVLFGKAGWTIERESLIQSKIEALGIAEAVKLTGFIDDLSLAALYRGAEIFIFPSLYEGFGLPVLEAMACGGCIVARDISAMVEVGGDACRLVDTSDSIVLAENISYLLNNPEQQAILRSKAMARATAFTASRMANETISVYRSVLSECLKN